MTKVVELLTQKYGEGVLALTLKDQYYNMREMVEPHPEVIDKAFKARSHITRQVYEEYQSQQLKSLPALDSCYGTELFNTYMEALHSLPKELQRVYVMSRYKQLTHKEIADKLEVSVQTVNYRIGKALQFFRIRLKDFCLE